MAEKTKILIVDDTIDTVELLRKRLRADGYDTDEAFDGEEGLRKVRDYAPDLVVLDIMMPKLDGFGVCDRLKGDENTRHIPILMLTAKSEVPDKVKGLDIGADGYITKPFDYKEVAARIRSLLAKKSASEDLVRKEKSDALDQMVDEVSHEIRNPLVAIGGFARRIRNNLAEGDQNVKYLDVILQNVSVLEKMVDHLVALKSATLSYTESADINEIAQKALDRHQTALWQKDIRVTTRLMDNPPPLAADAENLTAALANIIENSIEAMDGDRRELTVSTDLDRDYFEIQIADTGKGISKDKIKNIYDPFFTSKTYGPGLGLTFALKTIHSHKGMITVDSSEHMGTTFSIRLPARAIRNASDQ